MLKNRIAFLISCLVVLSEPQPCACAAGAAESRAAQGSLWSAPAMRSFPAGNGGWQLGTLAVGNIDADPSLEIIVPYRDSTGPRTLWFLGGFKADGRPVPGFPYPGGEQAINVSPTLFDLDGDGRAEILFTHGHRVVTLRGDGTIVWSTLVSHQNYVPDAGYQAVTNGFYWSADGQWRDRLPETAQFFSEVSPPLVVDLTGNGSRQVVTAWKVLPDSTSTAQDFNPFIKPLYGFDDWGTVGDVWSGGTIFFDAQTGRKDFIYHIHQLVESGLGVGRSRPGRAPLVYVLNDSDSVVAFDRTQPYGLWGKGMLHKQFGKNQRLQSGSYLKGVEVYPADLDGDGDDELLVPTTQLDPLWQPCETILDDDGAVLWRQWKQASHISVANGWLNNACMIPLNPDHDNHIDVLSYTHDYEVAFRYWNGIELVDHPGWPKRFAPFLPTPPVVGDVDGDGHEEIILGTYDPAAIPSTGRLHIFALDGTEKAALNVPGGLKHIPALADLDANGSLDLIYRSLQGEIFVLNFGAGPGARVSWSTHRGNMQRDGHRDTDLFPEGTPIITHRQSGYRRTSFAWRTPEGQTPLQFEIFRAEQAAGPFSRIATLAGGVDSFADTALKDGCQYFYEVRAVYAARTVPSAPFAILALFNGNLVANSGFEENNDSHWDKWFTGKIPWQQMVESKAAFQGQRCMEIKLVDQGESSSIKQSNQYGTPDPAIRTVPGRLYSFGGWFRSGGLSQASEHWLEWNTTRTGENTNDIPSSPWPLYFTPHLVLGTEPSAWTYVNRVFEMPPGFPNIELRHRYSIAAPGSGSVFIDNVFFRELPALSQGAWVELIPFGSRWRYTSNEPPSDWFRTGFDDHAWTEAPAKFGGGTGTQDIVTPLPLMQPSYYFRRTFDSPAGAFEELLLSATATDDYNGRTYPLTVYLNGTELVTSGLDAVTGTGGVVKHFDLLPFADLLQPGQNTIAVRVQNGWATDWDNVAFDLRLQGIAAVAPPAPAQFQSIRPTSNGGVTLQISGPKDSRWRLESAASPAAAWQTIQTVTLDSAGTATALDGTAQHESENVSSRFYRLIRE